MLSLVRPLVLLLALFALTGPGAPGQEPAPVKPDFTLTASPQSQTVTRPHSTTYTVSLSSRNGYSGSINLSVSRLPSRTSSSFNVNPVAVSSSGTATSTLTITTQRKTSPGTYTPTIQGTDGTRTHTYAVTLVIQ